MENGQGAERRIAEKDSEQPEAGQEGAGIRFGFFQGGLTRLAELGGIVRVAEAFEGH